ncbi:MAG TPA: hypothetical protein VKZ63_09960 [Kofleriaceae bacterium]|nr:hypothetical protein [Kofleriaceae bacterium]
MHGLIALSCPSCAAGQGGGEADSLLVVGALVLLPLVIGAIAAAVIARLARRAPD